jgi:2,3-diaminopropionate biosynthesis protein SbnA
MKEGLLSTVGNTPMVQLTKAFRDTNLRIFAKLEAFNPGGSIKDRAAISILRHAMEEGMIRPGTTVVESSSGNMGIGLAMACAYFGLRFICVVDPKTTSQNIEILKAYGAEIDMVKEPSPATGEFLQARLDRVKSLLEAIEDSYWPDQYSNPYNAYAHHQTMHEISTALDNKIDYLFCSVSTCGTLRGCADYVRENNLKIKIMAVDAVGSVIFDGKRAKRLIPGHGAAVRPELFRPNLSERCIHVSDVDCIHGCRLLVRRESLLAGGSSGGVLMALEKVKQEIRPYSTCVLIFPDRGERYLNTIYSDAWVNEHFGDISHLWQD